MLSVKYCNSLFRKASLMQQSMSTASPATVQSDKLVDVSFDNGIRKIKMCHTKTRNSLSIAMMQTLIENITRGQDDPALRVIVLTGVGPIFSAGHNLKELSVDSGREQHERVFSLGSRLMRVMMESPVPVIGRVDGLAAAAGCQLVAHCDLALCTHSSTFSTPGVNFGIFCSTPGIALARCIQKRTAMQMLLTGKPISSEEAVRAGLVNKVCSVETLDFELEAMCAAISANSRAVVALGKQFYYKQLQLQTDVMAAYQLGEAVMVHNVNIQDGQEGITSFIEKRKPNWNS